MDAETICLNVHATTATREPLMQKILLAANPEADEPWVAETAAELARETAARVSVLSVDELETEMLSTIPRSEYVERARMAASAARERLEAAGVAATTEVRSGDALDEILAYADEQDADLIVVGSSTRGRLASATLGNVPLNLVQRSKRPVMIVTRPAS
jgi:nucleotide-binding universal stress UspA family protein